MPSRVLIPNARKSYWSPNRLRFLPFMNLYFIFEYINIAEPYLVTSFAFPYCSREECFILHIGRRTVANTVYLIHFQCRQHRGRVDREENKCQDR